MNVTHPDPEGHTRLTPGGINRDLFDDALKAYARKTNQPFATVEDKLNLLGLKYPTDYQRLRSGTLPRLHLALDVAEMLGLDPRVLWPKPATRQRTRQPVAA